MSRYELLIDGRLQAAEHYDRVIDPASEEIVGEAARASLEQVDAAVDAAHRAFPAWATDLDVRRQSLARAAERVRENAQALAELITREQGRPLRSTLEEVAGVAATFEHHAQLELPADTQLRDDGERLVRITRKPLGVVAAITPWNVPLILLVLKIAPACTPATPWWPSPRSTRRCLPCCWRDCWAMRSPLACSTWLPVRARSANTWYVIRECAT